MRRICLLNFPFPAEKAEIDPASSTDVDSELAWQLFCWQNAARADIS